MKNRDYNKIEIEITNQDKENFSDEIFERMININYDNHLRSVGKIKWSTIFYLLFLFTIGIILSSILYYKIFILKENFFDHICMFILNILVYIPSLFYGIQIIMIFIGIEGFNFDIIPSNNN